LPTLLCWRAVGSSCLADEGRRQRPQDGKSSSIFIYCMSGFVIGKSRWRCIVWLYPRRIGYECRIEATVQKNLTILILLLVAGTEAFGQNQSASSVDTPKNSSELAIQSYGHSDVSCMEWSDSCVTCRRHQRGGEYSCSNIGIACQPKNVQCVLRGDEPAKPK
jgi:hypothetical protein